MKKSHIWVMTLCVASVGLAFTFPAVAIVIESQGADTEIIENATPTYVIEDPANGTMYKECVVVEWRDADAGGAPHWTATGTVDGSASQAWLRNSNSSITTTTTVASDGVTFNLEGDTNDGRCSLLVDGVEVARIDMWDSGHNRVLVIVRNLPMTTHTLVVDDLGATQQSGASGDDIAVFGGAAVNCANCMHNCPAQDGGIVAGAAGAGNKSSDLNSDGNVNLADLSSFALAFPSPPQAYDYCVDYNCDGAIALADLATFAIHFLHSGPQPGVCQ